jgi:cyanate permease
MLIGALYGLLSWLPALAPHLYFELLGYRVGRPLRWLMPSWWATSGVGALGLAPFEPAWLWTAVLVVVGVVLGAAVALGLRQMTRRAQSTERGS